MSQDYSLHVFDKMQDHNAQESIHASFKWYEKKVTGLYLSARSVVQYFIFQYDQVIFSILDFILLIAYQCHLFGLFFFKIKEIMNIKRCIIFSFEKYVMIKSMIMVNCAPFYLLLTIIFVKGVIYMILYIWQAFRLSGTTIVRKVCIQFEYVCKPVFCEHNLPVEATYIQVTKLGRKGPMTFFRKIQISLWLFGQIRWGLHWIVGK